MNKCLTNVKNGIINSKNPQKSHQCLSLKRLNIKNVFSLILIAFIFMAIAPVKSESVKNTANINFYGTDSNPSATGEDYLVFQQQGNQIEGMIYVQDSDIFSCLKGTYNPQKNQIENIIFSYSEMGTDHWETFPSDEPLRINEFPYSLNYQQINHNANELFLYCLDHE